MDAAEQSSNKKKEEDPEVPVAKKGDKKRKREQEQEELRSRCEYGPTQFMSDINPHQGGDLSKEDLINAKVRVELFDTEMLDLLLEGLSKAHYYAGGIKTICEVGQRTSGGLTSLVVHYDTRGAQRGRVYARGPSYQTMPNVLRGVLGAKVYEDHDIRNCFPNLMAQTFARCDIQCPLLNTYVNCREEALKNVAREAPHLLRKDIKEMFLQTLHCGDYRNTHSGLEIPFLTEMNAEIKNAVKAIMPFFPGEVAAAADKDSVTVEGKRVSFKGRVISLICMGYESAIMAAKSAFTLEVGWELGARIHDGEHVRTRFQSDGSTPLPFPHDACSDYVRKQTGFNVTFETKPMETKMPPLPASSTYAPALLGEKERWLFVEPDGGVAELGPNERGHQRCKVVPRNNIVQLARLALESTYQWHFGIYSHLTRCKLDAMRTAEVLGEAAAVKFEQVLSKEDTYPADESLCIEYADEDLRIKPLIGRVCAQADIHKIVLVDRDGEVLFGADAPRLRQGTELEKLVDELIEDERRLAAAETNADRIREAAAQLAKGQLAQGEYWDINEITRVARQHTDRRMAAAAVAKLMSEHFVLSRGHGRPVIYERRGQVYICRTVDDTIAGFQGLEVFLGDKCEKPENPVKVWMSFPKFCKRYDAVQFIPPCGPPCPPGVFNLFTRYAITQKEAERRVKIESSALGVSEEEYVEVLIKPLMDHIKNIVARGNEVEADWFIKWQAHIVQKPGLKTAMWTVLIGAQGAGKEVSLRPLMEILGRYAFVTHCVDSVVGQFTAPELLTVIFILFDECTFGGNTAQSNALKNLISGDTRKSRMLYCPEDNIPNFASCAAASNENDPKVELQDRRNGIFDLDPKYCGRQTATIKAYFDPIRAVPAFAWAWKLFHIDLDGFNPRNVIETKATSRAKLMSFDPHYDYLDRCLREGQLVVENTLGSSYGGEITWPEQSTLGIKPKQLYEMYKSYCECNRSRFRHKKPVGKKTFQDAWASAMPSLIKKTTRDSGVFNRVWILPSLNDAKTQFCAFLREPLSWFDD